MSSQMWDARYGTDEYAYGKEPNAEPSAYLEPNSEASSPPVLAF